MSEKDENIGVFTVSGTKASSLEAAAQRQTSLSFIATRRRIGRHLICKSDPHHFSLSSGSSELVSCKQGAFLGKLRFKHRNRAHRSGCEPTSIPDGVMRITLQD